MIQSFSHEKNTVLLSADIDLIIYFSEYVFFDRKVCVQATFSCARVDS